MISPLRILPRISGLALLFLFAFRSGMVCGGELSVGPANTAADLRVGEKDFTLDYDGARILSAVSSGQVTVTANPTTGELIEQRIRVTGKGGESVSLKATINGSSQAIAAETSGKAQQTFPMVRTAHGLSLNRRNHAVYDRFSDWMIELPERDTRITPVAEMDGSTRFEIEITGESVEIVFRPHFYQKHKNIRHFNPWTYDIRKDSITGWCSWWAYHNELCQEHIVKLLDVWQRKRMADFGYDIIQIDDVFQGRLDAGRANHPLNNGYVGGRPETWLEWKEDRFPGGMTTYVDAVRRAGFSPGVWIGCFFSDEATAQEHPEWFVRDKSGKPFAGPYVSYGIDATVPEAANRLVRPTYRGLHHAGFDYVKIDQLRHLLYDNLHHNPEYAAAKGMQPDDIFRAYLRTAREELGDETFILSCWGVLPESVGLADACRIGGDGYGPVTMQQYNSWNGIVWRNDPDHCDVSPKRKPAEVGNVRKTEAVTSTSQETIIRPALASIAGCLLMLSDKPEVYEDENNLVGVRRSSPVVFSVPGQLYDFDATKTDALKSTERTTITSGSMTPIDGDQHGAVCPWWLNEFNLGFDHWNVLHHLNWSPKSVTPQTVRFADLGLDSEREYLVYEFWTDQFLGSFKGSFEAPAIGAMGLHSFAVREVTGRPQLVSTNRHLSQGAVDLETLAWQDANTLSGRSRVVGEDRYVLTFHLPHGQEVKAATFDGKPAEITQDGRIARISFLPTQTGSVGWKMAFAKPEASDDVIKAFCLDFNWSPTYQRGRPLAKPGQWADADPAEHVAWYQTIGANVIQTFAVSTNGYAWYKNGVVPEQPGLKHDFLPEMVKLGHERGMKVFGYFTIDSNPRWAELNPTLTYGTNNHSIPYTDTYLDFLSKAISDAVTRTGMDGFMIDWVWMPKRVSTDGKWIDSEKQLYQQLTGEAFPGEDKLTEAQETAYSRMAIERCWQAIRKAAKSANPDCIIWLTVNKMHHPHVIDSRMYKEVDWLMNEAGSIPDVIKVRDMVGEHTKLITCLAAWNGANPSTTVAEAIKEGIGLYGFTTPLTKNGVIDLDAVFSKQVSEVSKQNKNIAMLARAYHGKSEYAQWKDGSFVEPTNPPPFSIKLRGRSRGKDDSATIQMEQDLACIKVITPYGYGRGTLYKTGDQWPANLVIQLEKEPGSAPANTNYFAVNNGKIGALIPLDGSTSPLLGEIDPNAAGLSKLIRVALKKDAKPVKVAIDKNPAHIRVTIPAAILSQNPQEIEFQWDIIKADK